jgi:hypothetical protein
MAETGRRLPKWQPQQISCHKKLFFNRFFLFDIQGLIGRIPIYLVAGERKMEINKFRDALVQIWGSESHNVQFIGLADGKLYAECAETLQCKRLTDFNYRNVLNDMFYDYCVEKAAWMGVS